MSLSFFISGAVSFKASAASFLYSQLRHKIEEQDSGEITEYHVFSSIYTLSPIPIPNAPPEAPSPMINTIVGTLSRAISKRLRAIASPCPRSSASIPGKAPGVSTKHTTGILNFSACFIKRRALRYPSGLAIPKLRYWRILVFDPFC